MWNDRRLAHLITLIRAALRPPGGADRIALTLVMGALSNALFAAGGLFKPPSFC